MTSQITKVRVFVASPGDVSVEREAIRNVIDEINLILSAITPTRAVIVELVKWETHTAPGLGRPQAVVNRQIDDYDIFVGIMWKRFGTPTGVADSGTEEEFQRAHRKWESDKKRPVLFYFCQEPFPPPTSTEEVDQLRQVVEFRQRLSGRGLTWSYGTHEEFRDVIRLHLVKVLGEMLNPDVDPVASAEDFGRVALEGPTSGTLDQVRRLATEYETVRASMESGQVRTGRMEAVTRRMKALATVAYPLVTQLSQSSAAGERLAAVAMLEMIPSPEYLDWLGDRFGVEAPFVEYHVVMALLTAVRDLDAKHQPRIRTIVTAAYQRFEDSGRGQTDRGWALKNVLDELDNQ